MAYKSTYHPRLCDCHECWEEIYPPIQDKTNQFRLLSIDEKGNGILETYSLDDPPAYSALSYAWRETTDLASEADQCVLNINGHPRQISYNLWSFLEHQCFSSNETKKIDRRRSKPDTHFHSQSTIPNSSEGASKTTYLWIDSVCIDQKSLHELNHQVALMKQIYSKASRVLVWLGDTDPKVRPLFTALNLEEHALSQKVSGQKEYDPYNQWDVYHGVLALFERRYWTRVWIVQEFLLACDLTICCGTYATPFELLYRLCCGLDDQSQSKYDGTLISPLTPAVTTDNEFSSTSLPQRANTHSPSTKKSPWTASTGTEFEPSRLSRASTTSTMHAASEQQLFADPDVSAASDHLQTLPNFRMHPAPLLLRSRARRHLDLVRLAGTSAPLKIYLESFFPAVANGRQCSDPRDRVYAILGLVADEDLQADYRCSLEQVFLMLVGRRSVRNVSRLGRMALAVLKPNQDAFSSTEVLTQDEGDDGQVVVAKKTGRAAPLASISTRVYFNNTSATIKFDIQQNRDPEMQVLEFCDCVGVHRREREKFRAGEGGQGSGKVFHSFSTGARRSGSVVELSDGKQSGTSSLPSNNSASTTNLSAIQTACPHATGWMCVTSNKVQPTDLAYWYPDSSLVLFVRHPPLATNSNPSELVHVRSNPETSTHPAKPKYGYIAPGFVVHSSKLASFLRIHRRWPANFTNLFNTASSLFANAQIRFKSMRDANADGGWSLEAAISPAALLFLLNQCEKDPLDGKETVSEMMKAGQERWGSRRLLWDGLRFPRPTTVSDDASGRSGSPGLSNHVSTRTNASSRPSLPHLTSSSRSNSRGLRQDTMERLSFAMQNNNLGFLDTSMTQTPPPMIGTAASQEKSGTSSDNYFSPMKATYVPTFNSEPDFMAGVAWDEPDDSEDDFVIRSNINRV